jgi:hypothetical protein
LEIGHIARYIIKIIIIIIIIMGGVRNVGVADNEFLSG